MMAAAIARRALLEAGIDLTALDNEALARLERLAEAWPFASVPSAMNRGMLVVVGNVPHLARWRGAGSPGSRARCPRVRKRSATFGSLGAG